MKKKKKKDFIQIGKRIQDARKKAGFTQEQLSEAIDVTPQYLSDLERGIVGTSVQTLVKICTTLRVSSDFLLFGQEENSSCSPVLIKHIQQLPEDYLVLLDQYLKILHATDVQTNKTIEPRESDSI